MLRLDQVSYSYDKRKKVLDDVSQNFEAGKFYAIIGQSGAGKSTLLSILGGLDSPNSGKVLFDDKELNTKDYETHRRKNISFIFQNYNLIDYLTAIENVRLVNSKADMKLLTDLGISKEEAKRNVLKLSGGQQQRVAIARALAANTPVILGDEPTGNLDEKTSNEIIELLMNSAHKENKCVIIVTHSKQVVDKADVVLSLENRKLH